MLSLQITTLFCETYHDSLFDKEKPSFVFSYSSTIATEQALSRSKLDWLGVFLESLKPFGKLFSVLETKAGASQ
jgi:hypothetical protein